MRENTRSHGWNLGGWLGAVGGGTLWMFGAAIEIIVRTGSVQFAALALVTAGVMLGIGWALWSQRQTMRIGTALLLFLGAGYPSALAVFAFRQLAGLQDHPMQQIGPQLTLFFALLSFQFFWIGRHIDRAGNAAADATEG